MGLNLKAFAHLIFGSYLSLTSQYIWASDLGNVRTLSPDEVRAIGIATKRYVPRPCEGECVILVASDSRKVEIAFAMRKMMDRGNGVQTFEYFDYIVFHVNRKTFRIEHVSPGR